VAIGVVFEVPLTVEFMTMIESHRAAYFVAMEAYLFVSIKGAVHNFPIFKIGIV
jgi:hypothetical protein